jgi:hypothetical protein
VIKASDVVRMPDVLFKPARIFKLENTDTGKESPQRLMKLFQVE